MVVIHALQRQDAGYYCGPCRVAVQLIPIAGMFERTVADFGPAIRHESDIGAGAMSDVVFEW